MSDAKPNPPSDPEAQPKRVKFHYVKSPAFHTLHADGLIGGPTPRGDLHLAFYAERLPIPNETQHAVNPDGRLGDEIRDLRVVKDGIFRELVVDIVMDLATAESLRQWLEVNARLLRERIEEAVSGEQKKAEPTAERQDQGLGR